MMAMSNRSIRFRSPRLWAIGCVLILGLTVGIVIADTHPDLVLHDHVLQDHVLQDTYFVVAHLQYVLLLPVVFSFFAGWYYLFPRITSYAYSDTLGRVHFWLLFIGVSIALVPQILFASGVASRMADAADWFRASNQVSRIGSYVCAASILVFFVNMALSFLRRRPAD